MEGAKDLTEEESNQIPKKRKTERDVEDEFELREKEIKRLEIELQEEEEMLKKKQKELAKKKKSLEKEKEKLKNEKEDWKEQGERVEKFFKLCKGKKKNFTKEAFNELLNF